MWTKLQTLFKVNVHDTCELYCGVHTHYLSGTAVSVRTEWSCENIGGLHSTLPLYLLLVHLFKSCDVLLVCCVFPHFVVFALVCYNQNVMHRR